MAITLEGTASRELRPRRSSTPAKGGSSPFADLAPQSQPVEDAVVLKSWLRGPKRLSMLLIGTFVFGFGTWSATAPLAGGAIAPGMVSPDGLRRTVQHLEGGIVHEILVKNGDRVVEGQPLLELANVQPQARHEMLLDRYRTLLATRDRLEAERLGAKELAFSEWPEDALPDSGAEEVESLRAAQRALFTARRERHDSGTNVLNEQIEQLRAEIAGLQSQIASVSNQAAIINEDLAAKEALLSKKLVKKSAVLTLRRQAVLLEGELGRLTSEIAQAERRIGEVKLAIIQHDATRADEIAAKLDEVRSEIVTVRENLLASDDVLTRTSIVSPVSGTIVDLRQHTRGGVIAPGQPVLDIVPSEEELLIDAQLALADRDVVHPGMVAQVHLLAYSSRDLPRIEGRVRDISADRITDQRTGEPHYAVRVEVDADGLKELEPRIELVAGMPAEVLIITGERTMLGYLTEPFRRSLRRGMRDD